MEPLAHTGAPRERMGLQPKPGHTCVRLGCDLHRSKNGNKVQAHDANGRGLVPIPKTQRNQ